MKIDNDRVDYATPHAKTQRVGRGERANVAAHTGCLGDEVFAQALRDDSNRELDWLWVYIQLTDVQQRRYCLERALAINPKSELALRELAKLPPRLTC
jgi:hypothetical protein